MTAREIFTRHFRPSPYDRWGRVGVACALDLGEVSFELAAERVQELAYEWGYSNGLGKAVVTKWQS